MSCDCCRERCRPFEPSDLRLGLLTVCVISPHLLHGRPENEPDDAILLFADDAVFDRERTNAPAPRPAVHLCASGHSCYRPMAQARQGVRLSRRATVGGKSATILLFIRSSLAERCGDRISAALVLTCRHAYTTSTYEPGGDPRTE